MIIKLGLPGPRGPLKSKSGGGGGGDRTTELSLPGGGGGYSLCKAIRGCAALVGHFFEKIP